MCGYRHVYRLGSSFRNRTGGRVVITRIPRFIDFLWKNIILHQVSKFFEFLREQILKVAARSHSVSYHEELYYPYYILDTYGYFHIISLLKRISSAKFVGSSFSTYLHITYVTIHFLTIHLATNILHTT